VAAVATLVGVGAILSGSSVAGVASAVGPSGQPLPSTPAHPNIVLILTDDQRATMTEQQPNYASIAGQGTTFTNAFVVNALCCPSRATILTGRYSHSTVVSARRLKSVRLRTGGISVRNLMGSGCQSAPTGRQDSGYRRWTMSRDYRVLSDRRSTNCLPPRVSGILLSMLASS